MDAGEGRGMGKDRENTGGKWGAEGELRMRCKGAEAIRCRQMVADLLFWGSYL